MLPAEVKASIVTAAAEALATHGIVAAEVDLDTGEVLAVHDLTAMDEEGLPEAVEEALISAIAAGGTGELSMNQGEVLAIGSVMEGGARVTRTVEVMRPGSRGVA